MRNQEAHPSRTGLFLAFGLCAFVLVGILLLHFRGHSPLIFAAAGVSLVRVVGPIAVAKR
jgi:hypothetical protein